MRPWQSQTLEDRDCFVACAPRNDNCSNHKGQSTTPDMRNKKGRKHHAFSPFVWHSKLLLSLQSLFSTNTPKPAFCSSLLFLIPPLPLAKDPASISYKPVSHRRYTSEYTRVSLRCRFLPVSLCREWQSLSFLRPLR